MPFKCLIVEDEPLAARLIENHISKTPNLELVEICNNALKAFEILNKQDIDLLFLDIKMPSITGLDFLRALKNPPKTIITTAYRDYAIEGFELGVIDYLLKPITFERFFKATSRFFNDHQKTEVIISNNNPSDFIIIKSGNKHHKIILEDILYIESLKDYVQFFLVNDKRIVSKNKISDIEADLNQKHFLRIHRSHIINLKRIDAFTTNEVEIKNKEIPIGASYKEQILKVLYNLNN